MWGTPARSFFHHASADDMCLLSLFSGRTVALAAFPRNDEADLVLGQRPSDALRQVTIRHDGGEIIESARLEDGTQPELRTVRSQYGALCPRRDSP